LSRKKPVFKRGSFYFWPERKQLFFKLKKCYYSGMKNYSSARAGKGKTAYRTPSQFRYQKCRQNILKKAGKIKVNRKDHK
jgi:hypothetical protein